MNLQIMIYCFACLFLVTLLIFFTIISIFEYVIRIPQTAYISCF